MPQTIDYRALADQARQEIAAERLLQQQQPPAQQQQGGFWGSPMGKIIGPTVEAWNPINMVKGLGQAAVALPGMLTNIGGEMASQGRNAANPFDLAMGLYNSPTARSMGQSVIEGVLTPITKGVEKFNEGDYTGAFGEAIGGASQFVGPKFMSGVLTKAAKATGANKLPAAIAKYGIGQQTTVDKNFPGVDYAQTAIDRWAPTVDAAKKSNIPYEMQLQDIVQNQMPGSVPSYDVARGTYHRVRDEGRFEGRGPFKAESEAKASELFVRDDDRWAPAGYKLTAPDLLEQKRGLGDLDAWSKDKIGDATASNVDALWKQHGALESRDQLNDMAARTGNPSTTGILKEEQKGLALQHALTGGGRRSPWAERAVATGLFGGGIGYGLGGNMGALVGAGLVEAMSQPYFAINTAATIDRLARAITSRPGIGTATFLGQSGRD